MFRIIIEGAPSAARSTLLEVIAGALDRDFIHKTTSSSALEDEAQAQQMVDGHVRRVSQLAAQSVEEPVVIETRNQQPRRAQRRSDRGECDLDL